MNHDKFIGTYVSSVKQTVQSLKEDLSSANLSGLYQAGLMQGEIRGLETALDILEAVYADQDK